MSHENALVVATPESLEFAGMFDAVEFADNPPRMVADIPHEQPGYFDAPSVDGILGMLAMPNVVGDANTFAYVPETAIAVIPPDTIHVDLRDAPPVKTTLTLSELRASGVPFETCWRDGDKWRIRLSLRDANGASPADYANCLKYAFPHVGILDAQSESRKRTNPKCLRDDAHIWVLFQSR